MGSIVPAVPAGIINNTLSLSFFTLAPLLSRVCLARGTTWYYLCLRCVHLRIAQFLCLLIVLGFPGGGDKHVFQRR